MDKNLTYVCHTTIGKSSSLCNKWEDALIWLALLPPQHADIGGTICVYPSEIKNCWETGNLNSVPYAKLWEGGRHDAMDLVKAMGLDTWG
jgi:hypothetical protein